MIVPFTGGYLFHPAALEYSGNSCQHGCCYCFANINKEAREVQSIKSPIKQLYRKDPTSPTDLLLSLGYAICLSNRTDPFSPNEYRNTIALAQHLAKRTNGIFIQTKTGRGMDDVCEILGDRRDIVWYITVTTTDPDISRRIEPTAPLPSARIETAKRLAAQGYMVAVAVNPCEESWMSLPALRDFALDMQASGIRHICIEKLDLSPARIRKLSPRRQEIIGPHIIAQAKTKNNLMYVRRATEMLVNLGMSVAKRGMPWRTDCYADMSAQIKTAMPMQQDFVNYCYDTHGDNPAIITYEEYEKVMVRGAIFNYQFPGNQIREYILRSDFRAWRENNDKVHTHKDLLKIFWNDKRTKTSIQHHCLFRVLHRDDKPALDTDGNLQLYWDGSPTLIAKKQPKQI